LSGGPSSSLRLLKSFAVLHNGEHVALPEGAQRLIALVALQNRPVQREYAAGLLWIDHTDARAAANLRSTLWRVQKRTPGLIDASARQLALRKDVDVDLRTAEALAQSVLDGDASVGAHDLADDLLPDWYDDWLVLERERFRQLRLLALEALCERHLETRRHGKALEAALVALAGDPLRESTHRALIRVHLATGNTGEALRQYALCRRLLRDQLGLEPSEELGRLLDDGAVTAG
jgi:DNA-binding SARP family transcriptional activator